MIFKNMLKFFKRRSENFDINDPFSEELHEIPNYYNARVLVKLKKEQTQNYDIILIATYTNTHF